MDNRFACSCALIILIFLFHYQIIQMSTEYERLMKQYDIPPGALTAEELRLLKNGGIRLDDSDQEGDYQHSYHPNRQTKPTIPSHHHGGATESEALKQIYENEISKKDKQIWYLQNESAHRQKMWDAERQRIEQEYQLEIEKVLSELRRARAQIIHTEGQIPLIKEALHKVREMLSGMESETVYLRMKDIPERDLPPSEWLLVNVWELIYPYKKEMDYSKREITKLREEIKVINDKQHSLLNELDHYQRLLNSKDDDEKRHSLNFDNNKKCMELEIDKLREECELLRQKGARYDELFRDYQFTKQEKELIEEKLGFYDKAAQKESVGSSMGHEEAQRRKMDLLSQDKEYLTKENIGLIEKNRRLEDRLDRLEAELLSAKNQSQEYLGQLLNLKTDSVSNYEQKIYREISELKEKHNHELEMAKNNLVDIYEKQIRFLREALDEKEIKAETLERELREKTKENETLMIDTRSFQRKFDGDLSEARLSLKIKSEELDRISNIYQETLGNLNAHKLENDMLREKLNCLKGQYYKQDANNKDEMSSLKAQVHVLREQLANYEIIEKQIDQAVLSLGKLNPNDNSIFTHTLTSVPSSNKRRIQQALGLAQRLQAKQKDHEETLELLRLRENELEQVKDELKVARTLLDKTNQPYSYLVSNIEEREKEIMMLRKENKKMEQDYQNIREEHRAQSRQLEEAEKDVQRLLLKRESIQNIQRILIDLTRGPTTSQQINGAIEEIRDILGSTQSKPVAMVGQERTPVQDGPPAWYRKLAEKKR